MKKKDNENINQRVIQLEIWCDELDQRLELTVKKLNLMINKINKLIKEKEGV